MNTPAIPQTLNDVLIAQLRELYSVESQFLKTLPKMAEMAKDENLKAHFLNYHSQVQHQLTRLAQAAELLRVQLGEHPEAPMVAFITGMAPDNTAPSMAMDAHLICGAHKVESYQKAGSVGICTFARMLGMDEIAALLLGQKGESQPV